MTRVSPFPEGTRQTGRGIILPRPDVDEILRKAALKGYLHLQDRPYKTVANLVIDPWHKNLVYGVYLALDGSTASVGSYWGSSQGSVLDAEATASQLHALIERWGHMLRA